MLGHFLRPRPGAAGRAASHARWRMYLAPASEGLVAARYVRTALCPPLWPPHLRVPTNCQSSENPVYGVYKPSPPLKLNLLQTHSFCDISMRSQHHGVTSAHHEGEKNFRPRTV